MEKPLDSYERENSAESRQKVVKAHWLRKPLFPSSLTGPPAPSFLSSLPPSHHPVIHPSILLLLLSFRHRCAILWLPPSQLVTPERQPSYSLRTTCRHDPKHTHTPRSQTGAQHTRAHTAAKETGGGGARRETEGALCGCLRSTVGRNDKERGMERREKTLRRREKIKQRD